MSTRQVGIDDSLGNLTGDKVGFEEIAIQGDDDALFAASKCCDLAIANAAHTQSDERRHIDSVPSNEEAGNPWR